MSQKQAKRARKALREAAKAEATEQEFKRPEPVRRIILRPKRLIDFQKDERGMKVARKQPASDYRSQYQNYLKNTGKPDTPESFQDFKNYTHELGKML